MADDDGDDEGEVRGAGAEEMVEEMTAGEEGEVAEERGGKVRVM